MVNKILNSLQICCFFFLNTWRKSLKRCTTWIKCPLKWSWLFWNQKEIKRKLKSSQVYTVYSQKWLNKPVWTNWLKLQNVNMSCQMKLKNSNRKPKYCVWNEMGCWRSAKLLTTTISNLKTTICPSYRPLGAHATELSFTWSCPSKSLGFLDWAFFRIN